MALAHLFKSCVAVPASAVLLASAPALAAPYHRNAPQTAMPDDARIVMTDEPFEYAEYERFCRETPGECDNAPPVRVPMTHALRERLDRVNLTVNVNYRYRYDAENYGVQDRWTLPGAASGWTGDCEDWALYKRQMLKDVVPAGAMRIAYLGHKDPKETSHHAVLVVTSDDGDYILDIRHAKTILMRDSEYVVEAMTDPAAGQALRVANLPDARPAVSLAAASPRP